MPHSTAEARRAWYRANAAAAERSRAASRAAKQRRRGTCEDCGAVTRYNGRTVNGPSRWCPSCGSRHSHDGQVGPMQARLYALLRERGEARYMEIARALGISKNYVGAMLNHELGGGRIARVSRGLYSLPLDRKRGRT